MGVHTRVLSWAKAERAVSSAAQVAQTSAPPQAKPAKTSAPPQAQRAQTSAPPQAQLTQTSAPPAPQNAEAVRVFNGLTMRQAKRRALSYWYDHQPELGLSATEFFAHCRVTEDAGLSRITFYRERPKFA